MDLVDDDGLYREDGMWNTYFHLSQERETVARFDDIFDLCSLVRLRFICQIWHIFTSIWAMYPISLGYKLIFDSPQSD